jgi:hypothetical protein
MVGDLVNILAPMVAAIMAAAAGSAASTLDFHVTTGDSGLQAAATADVRDGLHATATWNDTGMSGNARITLGPATVTIDKPPGQPLQIGMAGLSIAPAAPAAAHRGDRRLIASTAAVAAAPSVGFLDGLGAAGSAVADVIVRWFRAIIPFLLLGLLFMLLLPALPRAVRATSMSPPWARLGIGLVVLIAMPSAAIALLVAGVFLGVWWLGIMMLGLYGVALAAGFTFTGMILGRAVFDRLGGAQLHLFWTLTGGLALLSLLSLVPYVGAVVGVLAVTYGMGALALAPRTPPTSAVPAVLTQRFRHATTSRPERQLVSSAETK